MSEIGDLVVIKGDGNGEIHLPMIRIANLEKRQLEVQIVTHIKAPELLTALNEGWLETSKLALRIHQEIMNAEKLLSKRKAIILLDEMPRILKEKQIDTVNESIRKAIIDQDAQHNEIEDRLRRLEAIEALLKIKAKGFENAFTAVKKIISSPTMALGPGNLSHEV